MSGTVVNNENGATSKNVSDRVLLVTVLLAPDIPVTTDQVIAMYRAATGRTVTRDVMRSVLRDAERRWMVKSYDGDRWAQRRVHWESFSKRLIDAMRGASST